MAVTEKQAQVLAQVLREAAHSSDVSHNDLCKWLSDALQDCKDPGEWCCFQDFVGDGESGTVYFYSSGDLTSAPYTITQSAGKMAVKIDMAQCADVLAVTVYKTEGEEDEPGGLNSSMEALRGLYLDGELPLYERSIPKKARDKMDPGSFAGKKKSFPIAKPEDVPAALHSIGRAGPDNHPPEKIKANIKKIAKKKGFPLPKSLQDDDASESARVAEAGARHNKSDQSSVQAIHDHALKLGADPTKADPEITGQTADVDANEAASPKKAAQTMHDKATKQDAHDAAVKLGADCPDGCKFGGAETEEAANVVRLGHRLVESASLSTDFRFVEAAALSPLVKIISPGRGSSGYYTKEVLQRDGPGVFGRGTLMFVNHATEAEQNARPEGDWSQLAAVTEAAAHWDDNGPDGPALYAPAAVFSKFAAEVKEKAPYTGVSINARGHYAESATGLPNPKVKIHESKIAPDGKPGLIARITCADSIDLVTKAGRDGKLLLESASQSSTQQQESSAMADENHQQLNEALAEIRKLKERAAIGDAAGAVAEYFRTVQVSEAIRARVTTRVLAGSIPFTETGDLDRKKTKEFAEAQLNDELAFLRQVNPNLVTGMGPSGGSQQLSEAQLKEQKRAAKSEKKALKESSKRFADRMGFGGQMSKTGRKIMREGRGAFDLTYNARLRGVGITPGEGSLGMEA